jgi:hypothetical protein
MPRYFRFRFVILMALTIFNCSVAFTQDHALAFKAADTSRFSPNKTDGWQLFNSYVGELGKDSADFELIIQHANNLEWSKENIVGRITYQKLIPSASQSAVAYMLSDYYRLRVDPSGKCYLTYLDGAPPTANPVVVAIKIHFKL